MSSTSIAAVKQAIEGMQKALTAGDLEALGKCTAKELTFGHASGRVETQQQFISSRVGKAPTYAQIVASDQRFEFIDNVAVVHQTITRGHADGKSVTAKEMLVWMLKDGQWKLVARQCIKPPKK